jgi:hypothetical protein
MRGVKVSYIQEQSIIIVNIVMYMGKIKDIMNVMTVDLNMMDVSQDNTGIE